MLDRLLNKVLQINPVLMGLLLILLPIVALIINGVVSLILLIAGYKLLFPIWLLGITMSLSTYFLWIWAVSVKLNNEKLKDLQISTRWFKIAFWLFFSYCAIHILLSLELDITSKGFYMDTTLYKTLETIGGIYGLSVLVAYVYLAMFTARIIRSLEGGNRLQRVEAIPITFLIMGFPLGIPLLQARAKNGFELISYMHKKFPWQ